MCLFNVCTVSSRVVSADASLCSPPQTGSGILGAFGRLACYWSHWPAAVTRYWSQQSPYSVCDSECDALTVFVYMAAILFVYMVAILVLMQSMGSRHCHVSAPNFGVFRKQRLAAKRHHAANLLKFCVSRLHAAALWHQNSYKSLTS